MKGIRGGNEAMTAKWKLVPVEQTTEMQAVAQNVAGFAGINIYLEDAREIYSAMLEDAPQPPRLSDERIAQVIERAKAEWDAEADKHNQWGSLGLDEISLLIVRAIEREIFGGEQA